MNALDATLQSVCPTLMVPKHSPLVPMETDGHRYLVAANGFFVEVRRPWLHWTALVSPLPVPLPYGTVEPQLEFKFTSNQLRQCLKAFMDEAVQASPDEHAGWFSFSGDGLRYEPVHILGVSADIVRYERPVMEDGSVLAVDIHSHARCPAFFSGTDNSDDIDDIKLSIVVGNLESDRPNVVARLTGLRDPNQPRSGIDLDLSVWIDLLLPEALQAT